MPACLRYPSRPAPAASSDPAARHCLLYFVPGNPGLVDYYAPFLATLRLLLDEVEDRQPAVRFHIEGWNLLGFGMGCDEGESGDQKRYGPGPYDLDTQIRATMDKVCAARRAAADDDDDGRPFDDVVLIGHSVGSYISVEVIRRCEEKGVTPAPHSGILLFATLTHLAQSPRGQQLARLLAVPLLGAYVPQLLQTVAHGIGWLPAAAAGLVERVVVRGLLRFPAHAAAATLRFLTSPGGVRQALYLGGDELATIREDVWAEAVWATTNNGHPKFVIFFGQDDHWVANAGRDEFIARQQQNEGVRIVLDDTGLPHAFCIRHSEPVAERVKTWACAVLGVE